MMEVKEIDTKEKLVMCKDCANYPTMCGYYRKGEKNKKHTCPDMGEGQHGFRPATEMSLKDTIYSLKMHMNGLDKNTALFDMVLYYLRQGENYRKELRIQWSGSVVVKELDEKYFPGEAKSDEN